MALEKRQKILIPLIALALVFVVWQMYSLFFAGSSSSSSRSTTATTVQRSAPTTNSRLPGADGFKSITPTTTRTQSTTTVAATASKPEKTSSDLPEFTSSQKRYLKLINRYQLVRMQRMVIDQEAAIAQAKERIASLSQTGVTNFDGSGISSAAPAASYSLIYVDYQHGEWTATISRAGRYQNVAVDDRLADGSVVTKINRSGVVVEKNNKDSLINFSGTMPLPKQQANARQPLQLQQRRPVNAPTLQQQRQAPQYRAPSQPFGTPQLTPPNQRMPQFEQMRSSKNISKPTVQMAQKKVVQQQEQPVEFSPIPSTSMKSVTRHAVINRAKQVPLTSQEKKTYDHLQTFFSQQNKQQTAAATMDNTQQQLLKEPASNYTVQLMGSRDRQDLVSFVQRNKLENKTNIFPTYYLGKEWFVLVYGNYKTSKEAQAALGGIPVNVKGQKPWVRPMASVQQAIKLYR